LLLRHHFQETYSTKWAIKSNFEIYDRQCCSSFTQKRGGNDSIIKDINKEIHMSLSDKRDLVVHFFKFWFCVFSSYYCKCMFSFMKEYTKFKYIFDNLVPFIRNGHNRLFWTEKKDVVHSCLPFVDTLWTNDSNHKALKKIKKTSNHSQLCNFTTLCNS